ncbi:GNVR domain-containing protein [Massilia sp. GCM10023247]|uniref:GNVR domain-containing protein n=1 Tax=Massilia sp. GCM10023247 TaxID=3252643 RepID=UPI00361BE845
MNEPMLRAPRSAPLPYDDASHGTAHPYPFWKYAAVMRSHKAFIALATCLCALLGYLYSQLAAPEYQASMLVQVDDVPAPTDRLLGEMTPAGDLLAATAREIEVLRSRFVVARAVDSLRLFIDARPRYLPLAGHWLAARNAGLSEPVLPELAGYVWGAERLGVSRFEVPPGLFDSPFELVAGRGSAYLLVNYAAGLRLAGQAGQPARWVTARGEIALTVDKLVARPGARFVLRRIARLDSIEQLQRDLDIAEQGKQSGVIGVRLKGKDPERLALILNEIGRQYIRQNEERRSAGAGKALAFVERQLPALEQGVEAAESGYNRMRKQLGSIDLGEEARTLLQQAGTAQARLLDLTQKRTELSGRFADDHPMMVTANEQIAALEREAAALNARIKRLPQVEQEIVRLGRDVKVSTEVYTAALASAQQLRLSAANRAGNARLLDPADIPASPLPPRAALAAGAAAGLGLLLSSLVAGMRRRWEWRVDQPGELERQLGLAVAAAIPHSAAQRKLGAPCAAILAAAAPPCPPRLLQLALPQDGAVEALRRLRPLLHRALAGAEHVVAITGPAAGVGKSFVAANLAAVLGAAGKRVLLIDADLRTGGLRHAFPDAHGPGLAEYLAGSAASAGIVRAQVAPGVDLIPAGALPRDPAELLARDAMRELLRSLAPAYDYVLLDTAPVLAAADTLAVAALAALTLNVARSRVTSGAEIEESTRQLRMAGAHVAGVILNVARTPAWRAGPAAAGRIGAGTARA